MDVVGSRPPPQAGGFDFQLLKSEQARLDTFKKDIWPLTYPSVRDLAKSGFFCLGVSDKVQCVFCHGVAGEWEQTDIPHIEHRRHFPRCPFTCNLPVGNIPLHITFSEKCTQTGKVQDNETQIEARNVVEIPNKTLDSTLCKICFDEFIQIVYMPCAHAASCILCAKSICKCVICNRPIESKTRIFLA
jgi:Inhibitor of Apoptosis domain/Zinc finger, C3HC4 type (RING finger)